MSEAPHDLLPPPLPPSRPFPWAAVSALFVPAAALAAGTGLQRLIDGPITDPVRWLLWSSVAGLLVGVLAGLLQGQKLVWAAYGLATPWIAAGLVSGSAQLVRPLRDKLADQREASCRAEGRPICTLRDFTARCGEVRADPSRAKALLGEPRTSSCGGQGCTLKWLYLGPFRSEQYAGPGALACFVLTDPQGRGVRHWLMAAELPTD